MEACNKAGQPNEKAEAILNEDYMYDMTISLLDIWQVNSYANLVYKVRIFPHYSNEIKFKPQLFKKLTIAVGPNALQSLGACLVRGGSICPRCSSTEPGQINIRAIGAPAPPGPQLKIDPLHLCEK